MFIYWNALLFWDCPVSFLTYVFSLSTHLQSIFYCMWRKLKLKTVFYFIGLFYSGSSHTAVDIKYLCLTVKGKGWLCYNLEIRFLLKFLQEKRVTSQLKGHAHEMHFCQFICLLSLYGPVQQTYLGVQKSRGHCWKQEQGANLVCYYFAIEGTRSRDACLSIYLLFFFVWASTTNQSK